MNPQNSRRNAIFPALQSCIERGLSVPVLESNSVWFGLPIRMMPNVRDSLLDLVQKGLQHPFGRNKPYPI